MPGRGGNQYHKRSSHPRRHDSKPATKMGGSREVKVDEDSPVIKLFRLYQSQLDARHDKHERIVKLSRDITIDSKRTIFLLQRTTQEEKQNILEDASAKLEAVRQTKWKVVATELQGCDPYQFLRAYSPGLQEYIEAVSFYHYLKEQDLISLEEVQAQLVFTIHPDLEEHSQTGEAEGAAAEDLTKSAEGSSATASATAESSSASPREKEPAATQTVSVHIPPTEYMLGLADLTGELMRMAIYSVGQGNLEVPYQHCAFMRTIYDAFVSYGNVSRELVRKLSTLRQSLCKVENACYTLQVRGSEIPQHMLADVFTSIHEPAANTAYDYDNENYE